MRWARKLWRVRRMQRHSPMVVDDERANSTIVGRNRHCRDRRHKAKADFACNSIRRNGTRPLGLLRLAT